MKPVIAITPESITLEHRWDGRGSFCGVSYSRAVERAGGVPMILPLTRDRALLNRFLAMSGGLLLIGGGDVDPARYGMRLPPAQKKALGGVDDVRDDMEIYLCRRALAQELPTLGICRGIQVMNVAFGGTLVPHVAGHRHPRPDARVQRITWTQDGLLKRLLRGVERVNTSHHQAVDRLAGGFTAVARAADGIVEAMERTDARFFCAVQFHPGRLVNAAPGFLRLFKALVKAAKQS